MKFSLICQHCDKMESAIVELLGLDVFDPTTMKVESEPDQNRPCLVSRHRLQRFMFLC